MRKVKTECKGYIFIIICLLILLVGCIDYNTKIFEECAGNLSCNTNNLCEKI